VVRCDQWHAYPQEQDEEQRREQLPFVIAHRVLAGRSEDVKAAVGGKDRGQLEHLQRIDQRSQQELLQVEIQHHGRTHDAETTEGAQAQTALPDQPGGASGASPGETNADLEEKIAQGEAVYTRTCISCHQANGQGLPNVYPPLAESDYLVADIDRAIRGVIKGQQGEIVVRGKTYNMLMPPQQLSDEEIAQVLTFVLNRWGNPGGNVTVEQVRKVRAASK